MQAHSRREWPQRLAGLLQVVQERQRGRRPPPPIPRAVNAESQRQALLHQRVQGQPRRLTPGSAALVAAAARPPVAPSMQPQRSGWALRQRGLAHPAHVPIHQRGELVQRGVAAPPPPQTPARGPSPQTWRRALRQRLSLVFDEARGQELAQHPVVPHGLTVAPAPQEQQAGVRAQHHERGLERAQVLHRLLGRTGQVQQPHEHGR